MLQKTPTDRTKQNTVLEKLIVGQLLKNFPDFKKHDGSLPCSQGSGRYSELTEYNSHTHILRL